MSVFSRITERVARAAILAAIMGCGSDLGVGPRSEGSGASSLPQLQTAWQESAEYRSEREETQFTLHPAKGGTFSLGRFHSIAFDRNAVCDPRHSSYGPEEWDKPCAPLHKKITITAVSTFDAAGRPYVKFEPELRFVPGRTVTLYLFAKPAQLDESYKILYCRSGSPDGTCVDESLSDPSLVTRLDPRGHSLYRRIKHFSGFYVAAE
jgi:hypothetical protein